MTGKLDPAVSVMIAACSKRQMKALSIACTVEADAQIAEGHDMAIVATGLINAALSLLASAIVTHVSPALRQMVLDDAMMRANAAVEASIDARAAGEMLQ